LKPDSPTRSGLQISTFEGVASNFQYILMQSSYLMGMGFLFGLSEKSISILASFSYLFQLFYFLSVYLLDRWVDRKKFVMGLALFARTSWVIPALLLLTDDPTKYGWIFVLLFTGYFFLDKMLAHSWNSWMSDLVPMKLRGKYFGFRQGITAIVSVIFHLIIAGIIDYYKGDGKDALGFSIVLGISAVLGVVTVILFRYQSHPPHPVKNTEELFHIDRIKFVFTDKLMTGRMLRVSLIMMSIGMVIMFIPVYMIEQNGISYTTFAWYQNGILFLGVAGYRLFGKIIDYHGADLALKLSVSGMVLSASLWLFIDSGNLWLFFVDAIVLGFCYSGFMLSNATIALSDPKDPDRNLKIAVYASITGLMFFAGSLLSGMIFNSGWGTADSRIHLIFIVALVIRIFALILMVPRQKTQDPDYEIPRNTQVY